MASSSSGASSSSTSPSASKGKSGNAASSTGDKLPSSALIANVEDKDLTSSNEVDTEDDLNNICTSLSSAWVDDIRFSSYRLAAKLRLLQRRTGLVLLDVWNVIEAFRENGLNNVAEIDMSISKSKLEALLSSMYGALAKRLPPPSDSKDLEAMASWLFNWLFNALKPAGSSNIKLRTLKTAMSMLCSGKLLDKLRYLFSQLADSNGHMIEDRFAAFIRDIGRIASAVGEERHPYDESIFEACGEKPISVNDFIETLMSDPGPACLSWLPLLHRIANAESVVHYGLRCSSCRRENFRGLKYKSDRSANYQLCQACFWCGHIASDHKNDVFKEYNSHKPSSTRSTTPSSLKKINCLQGSAGNGVVGNGKKLSNGGSGKKKFPSGGSAAAAEHPEKHPMDLSSMMPPTSMSSGTLWSHPSSFAQQQHYPFVRSSASSLASSNPISDQHHFVDYESVDPYMAYPEDEHELIAAYAHQLANAPEAKAMEAMSSHSRNLVRELERKNREIMRDIHHLKRAHRNQRLMQMPQSAASADPSIVDELEDLRNHKADLEIRLDELQTARRDLMLELEELMKLLKVNNQMYYPGQSSTSAPATAAGGGGAPGGSMQPRVHSNNGHYDDVTDVSGLNIDRHRPPSSQSHRPRGVIANEDSINSASD